MATGVPSKNTINKKNIPLSLEYEGKKNTDSILSRPYKKLKKLLTVGVDDSSNRLFFGDNLEVLQFLRNNGYASKVNLIYIDPPFATTSDFINRQQQYAYSDNLTGGEYVEFLRERIILVKELLSDTGSIYLHLDNKMAFTMKVVMDEIFGIKNFRAFITRKKCSTKNYTKNTYGNVSDYILFYTKTDNYIWNRPYTPWDWEKMLEEYPCIDEKTGKRYKKVPIHAPGARNGETGKEWNGMLPPPGKHWQFTPEKLDELNARGEIYWSPTGNPRRKVFCEPQKGIPIQDIWLNYRDSINQSLKTTGYPTEKNIDMLKMIVEASSNKGDIVLDCFAGSGTTLDAAFQKNRHWIGVDNSIESLKAIAVRLISGMKIYGDYVNHKDNNFDNPQFDFFETCNFSVWGEEKNEKEIESIFIKQINEKLVINE